MRILVLVKEVPDTYGERRLDLETGLTERGASSSVIDEPSARALEAALTLAAEHEGSVAVLAMGPASAEGSLRKCIAMGAGSATLVSDPLFVGADLTLTAQVLAAALARLEHDLVLMGAASTDGATAVLGAMLSELLDLPLLSRIDELELTAHDVCGRRYGDDIVALRAHLPAIASVTERLPDPRMPGIRGILAAKSAEISVLSARDLGLDEAFVLADARSILLSVSPAGARQAGTVVVDGATDGGTAIADFLRSKGLA